MIHLSCEDGAGLFSIYNGYKADLLLSEGERWNDMSTLKFSLQKLQSNDSSKRYGLSSEGANRLPYIKEH